MALGNPFPSDSEAPSTSTSGTSLAEQTQIEFELGFFSGVLKRNPNYVDALRILSKLLTLKGRYEEGLQIDRRLVQLCATDPLAHYNLACRYARLKRLDPCLRLLRRAFELGYHDFHYVLEDRDLASVRHDPRFRQLIREFLQD